MSARAYIELSDVPKALMDTSRQYVDPVAGEKLIAFDDCQQAGRLVEWEDVYEIEYNFPRSEVLRSEFIAWLMRWGISFRVEM